LQDRQFDSITDKLSVLIPELQRWFREMVVNSGKCLKISFDEERKRKVFFLNETIYGHASATIFGSNDGSAPVLENFVWVRVTVSHFHPSLIFLGNFILMLAEN